MKTFLLKISIAFIAVPFFTSCLGEGDNYLKSDEDFAYINKYDLDGDKTDDVVAWLAAPQVAAKAPSSMKNLEFNRCYFVKYKIKANSDGYYDAEYMELTENDPIPKAGFENDAPYTGFPLNQRGDSIHPLSLGVRFWSPENFMDDNWMVIYTMSLKEDDKVEARFYYDPEGQEVDGKPLDDNQIIIDVRFVNVDKSSEVGNTTSQTMYAMGSLAQLRTLYTPKFSDGAKDVSVMLQFRYLVAPLKENLPPVVKTIGSFKENSGSGLYYMNFHRKQ